MISEIHYGGRITDLNDKILLNSMVSVFLADLSDDYAFSDSGVYRSFNGSNYKE
jgi:hypothetical protein